MIMKKKEKTEFSKTLLIQESVLIWVITLAFIGLAFFCVIQGFTASLPWLAAMVSFPWGAYGVSQAFYYNKSKKENSEGGITYEKMKQDFAARIPISESDIDGPI